MQIVNIQVSSKIDNNYMKVTIAYVLLLNVIAST